MESRANGIGVGVRVCFENQTSDEREGQGQHSQIAQKEALHSSSSLWVHCSHSCNQTCKMVNMQGQMQLQLAGQHSSSTGWAFTWQARPMRRIHLRSGGGREELKIQRDTHNYSTKLQRALTTGEKPPMVQDCNGVEAE